MKKLLLFCSLLALLFGCGEAQPTKVKKPNNSKFENHIEWQNKSGKVKLVIPDVGWERGPNPDRYTKLVLRLKNENTKFIFSEVSNLSNSKLNSNDLIEKIVDEKQGKIISKREYTQGVLSIYEFVMDMTLPEGGEARLLIKATAYDRKMYKLMGLYKDEETAGYQALKEIFDHVEFVNSSLK